MSAEADTSTAAAPAQSTLTTAPPAEGASAATKKKAAANSYYYWHGHEKERAKVGDVAPMPTPVLVKKDEAAALPPTVREVPVTKYSWADGDAHVTVYIDAVGEDKSGEQLDEPSVSVSFTKRTCDVAFVTRTTDSTPPSQRRRRLVLPLAKKIDARASSYKVRMPAARIVLRLTKASSGTWFDLVRDTHTTNADSPSASSLSDDDDEAEDEAKVEASTEMAGNDTAKAVVADATAADKGDEAA